MSTVEVRLTTQTGPSHPHPGVGGVSTPRRPNATVGGGFRIRRVLILSVGEYMFVSRQVRRSGGC
ncbi:MAG: hypothetical protein GX934_00025 [Burkholderiales bacterium]|nr:hypothetical protein [Burkholderiales bacterium]